MAKRHLYNDGMVVGSWVAPFRSQHLGGFKKYKNPLAIVVSLDPFRLISNCGEVYWYNGINRDNFYVIDSKVREIPEPVVKRMKREGIAIPDTKNTAIEVSTFSFRIITEGEVSLNGTVNVIEKSFEDAKKKILSAHPNAKVELIKTGE